MTELKLRLQERYALMDLLPKQGNFQLLTRSKNLAAALALGDEERAARKLLNVDGQIGASVDADPDEMGRVTGVQVHDEQYEIAVQVLKDAEAKSSLPATLLDAYTRLVLDPQNEVVREAEEVAAEVQG